MHPQSLYEHLGDDVFQALVAGFYARAKEDNLIGPMYPDDDWDGAEWRLKAFLTQYWGGPRDYSEQRGHPRLRMRHQPFPITRDAALRWLEIMEASMADIPEYKLPDEARAALLDHMQRVAGMVINTAG